MAIGAGNIWRYPRLAGQYGGEFVLLNLVFLFLWSIPLLMVEFALGRKTRINPIGAFAKALGKNYGWMGWFVGCCTTAIFFYYSVVTGWSLKYFTLAVSGNLLRMDQTAYWNNYSTSVYQPLFFHLASILLSAFVIYRGVVKGLEKFCRYVVPLLFILLVAAAIRAVSLNGAGVGLSYFFSFEIGHLGSYKVWLEALSQSAWSTGAGWGLLLTYAIYSREQENIASNSLLTGLGDNLASIIAGLAVIPTVFALSATVTNAQEILNSGNLGLAFMAIPQLFSKMPAGPFFSSIFFLALFFACWTSLISMMELAVRLLIDFGSGRGRAVILVSILTAAAGTPSAIFMRIFYNQDWVWGLGLLLSGAFFTFAVIKIGAGNFVRQWIEPTRHERMLAVVFKILFYFIIPLEFVFMLGWWLVQSLQWEPHNWWNPFSIYSLASTFTQWTVIIAVGIIFNNKMVKYLQMQDNT